MDVGAAGFGRLLPELEGRVRRAAFLGLDMEFTGLHLTFPQNNQPSLFDSPAERYLKVRKSIECFTVTQLGLAIFSKENSNKYVVHSYNFFLFPSTLGVADVEFTLSASSIQFLSHYGFDYNKFLKDGIPYMNELQEKSLNQLLSEGSWRVCSALDRDVVKKAIDEVTCWIAAAEEGETMILKDLSGTKQGTSLRVATGEYVVDLNQEDFGIVCNGRRVRNTDGRVRARFYVYYNCCSRYDAETSIGSGSQVLEVQLVLRQALQNVWTQPLEDSEVIVKKVSPQHRRLLENSSYDYCRKELILMSARGFTNLFQILVKAKKPLVGHNMFMDLCHLHDKFYKPLPESYEEFKRNIHNLFPVLIDTKTVTKSIWKSCQFPRVSTLLEAYEVLCSSSLNPTDPTCPVIALASDCSQYAEKKSPHEAGYDAFLCGSVLLKSAHLLLRRVTKCSDTVEADPSFSQYLTVLAEYLNKVNFIRGGVSSINFSGEDVPCQHPPLLVVRVRGWPQLNERQIYQELKALCRFDVRRLSENQFILLSNKFKHVRLVLRDYKHHPNLQISVYRHWRHSPHVNCLLQVSGIVALWSLLAFVLGGPPCCSL